MSKVLHTPTSDVLRLTSSLSLALLLALPAAAETFYVSASGDDGAAGTEAAPFATIQKAFSVIDGTGSVKLLSDIDMGLDGQAIVKTGADVTLDFNGKKVVQTTDDRYQAFAYAGDGGSLTFDDSATGGGITVTCTGTDSVNDACYVVYCTRNCDLTVNGGTFVATSGVARARLFYKKGNGTWTFNKGTYVAKSDGEWTGFLYFQYASGTTVVNDGTFFVEAKGGNGYGIYNEDTSEEIAIHGGDWDIRGTTWVSAFVCAGGTMDIDGGTFSATCDGDYIYGVASWNDGDLTIAGGTFAVTNTTGNYAATVASFNPSTCVIKGNPTFVPATCLNPDGWSCAVETEGYVDFSAYTGSMLGILNAYAYTYNPGEPYEFVAIPYVTGDLSKFDPVDSWIEAGYYSTRPYDATVQFGLLPVVNEEAATKADYPWTIGSAVAEVVPGSGTNYTILASAVAAAANGQTVKLIADVTESSVSVSGKALTFDLNGKTLTGKVGGSAIKVASGAGLTIKDDTGLGSITTGGASTTANGAGISSAGDLTLLNVSITNCVATGSGAGVYVSGGTFTVGGGVRIADNIVAGGANNVYLPAGKTVTVSTATPLTAGAKIGVTTEAAPTATASVSVTGTNGGDCSRYFSSDADYTVLNEANVVKFAYKSSAVFDVYRDGAFVGGYATLEAARNAVADGAEGAWTIRANKDYTATEYNVKIDVGAAKPVTFDTNGKTITIAENTRLFVVKSASSLTLSGTGTFVGNGTLVKGTIAEADAGCNASGALAVIIGGPLECAVGDGSILILDGPTVRGFRTEEHGGALCTTQQGNLEIRSGLITGCVSGKQGGGAIALEGHGGSFTMTGGTICGNTADNAGGFGGGGIVSHGTPVKMSLLGGVVSNNVSATTGAGIQGNATVAVGGDFRCVDNVDAATKGNLYLPSGVTLAVTNAPALAAGARIGVLTQVPAVPDPVAVTGTNDGDYSQYFTSDAGYTVVNEANVVKLVCCFNVEFFANHADVTRDGAAFTSTNAVLVYGRTVGIPQLASEGLAMVGWSKTAGATEPEYTDAEVATMTTEPGSSHTLYAVWKAVVRIPVFTALDGLSVVPQDGRTYEFKLEPYSTTTAMPETNLVTLTCPVATGDVAKVGFATNDVTNPWTMALPTGDYSYKIMQTTVARPGEKLDTGYWLVEVDVNTAIKPYVKVSNNIYVGEIDELGEDAFKEYIDSGEASFSSTEKALIFGSDTQKVVDDDAFNRAVVKSQFAINFTNSFSIAGKVTAGAAADGSVLGFVPKGGAPDIETEAGSSLGIYGWYDDYWDEEYYKPAQGKGIFLEFDTLKGDSRWADDTFSGAHFAITKTDAAGCPTYTGLGKDFGSDYSLPSSEMSYTIDFNATTKELRFSIVNGSTTYDPWVYNDPVAQFGTNEVYMLLSGAMRYGPEDSYGMGGEGDPAPKTKMTLDTFVYFHQMEPGSVDNTFRNRQEALVTYDANGGMIGVGSAGVETTAAFADAARYVCPVDPERKGYKFLGWFTSWTNGTDTIEIKRGDLLSPIADCTVYAKWASKAIGEDTLKFGGVLDEDGNPIPGVAGLEGATNELKETDFAIPDMSDNGTNSLAKPIVQIKEFAFCAEKYDRQHPGKELTSVTIPLYVTEIQSFAFENCTKLTNVTFSATRDYATHEKAALLIGDWAFTGSDVKELVFPAGSKIVLGKNSFSEAANLTNICILGEVEVAGQYPFRHIGENLPAGTKVKVRLSPTLAADADYVYALTNGMDYAHVEIDQGIEGEVEIVGTPDLANDPMTFTFSVKTDSPWVKVTETSIYLFYATTLAPDVFVGTENVIYPEPGSLVDNGDGTWTAKFAKPSAPAGTEQQFFRLCVGAER